MTADAWAFVIFCLAAIGAIGGGIGMVGSRDMVRAALSLVMALGSVAVVYVLLSADFLAVGQIFIYVGAIMILMLFAIMLTPGQVELPAMAERGQHGMAALVAIAIGAISLYAIFSQPWSLRAMPLNAPTSEAIGTLLMRPDVGFVLPFEIASLLLTAGMIGAIVIARED